MLASVNTYGDTIRASSGLGVEVSSSRRVSASTGSDVARVVGAGQDGAKILARTEGIEDTHSVHLAHDQLRDQARDDTVSVYFPWNRIVYLLPCKTRKSEVLSPK